MQRERRLLGRCPGAAQLHPPSLKTIVVNMGGMSNAWDHGVRYRGTYEMGRQLTWAWSQLAADAPSPAVKIASMQS